MTGPSPSPGRQLLSRPNLFGRVAIWLGTFPIDHSLRGPKILAKMALSFKAGVVAPVAGSRARSVVVRATK
jgi:hypothetical protein